MWPITLSLGGALLAILGGIMLLLFQSTADLDPIVSEICQVHARLAQLAPAAEPPTFFEFLRLDAYAYPFYPEAVSLHPGSEAYNTAKDAILVRSMDMSKTLYEDLVGGVKQHKNTANEEQAAVIASVAVTLLDDTKRQVYIRHFLPAMTSYKWWDVFGFGWGRLEWKDETGGRRKRLAAFCKW